MSCTGDSLGSTRASGFLRTINYSQATTLVNDGMDDGRRQRDGRDVVRVSSREHIKKKTQNQTEPISVLPCLPLLGDPGVVLSLHRVPCSGSLPTLRSARHTTGSLAMA
jgi:hypothetical protein